MRMGRGMVGGASLILCFAATEALADTPRPTINVGGARNVQHVAPFLRNVQDAVNMAHLQQLKTRMAQKCGAQEVAPGTWVRVDCHPYAPIPNTKPLVLSAARIGMLKRGLLKLGQPLPQPPEPTVKGSAAPPPGGGSGGADRGGRADDGSFPDTIDHRRDGTEGPVKNQEYTSMCTGFSLSSTMDNAILRLGGEDVTSPTHLWAHYGSPHMASAATGNLNKPIALWGTWPFSPKEGCELSRFDDDCAEHYNTATNSAAADRKIQQELSAADGSGKYKITSIESMRVPANPDDVAAVLATGADLWVAFTLDINAWGYRALQRNNNQIADWTDPEGGHAVMLAGYRTMPNGRKQFLVHNSWGTSWGDGGYAWISEAMVRKFMHAAYKIKVEAIGAARMDLTDDDCDSDELVDAVTGRCATECPDGARPSNGACPTTAARPAPPPPPAPPPAPAAAPCPPGQVRVGATCKISVSFGR